MSLPCEGELANGDAVVVRDEGTAVLLAVVDAVGHGPLAATVAATAEKSLLASPLDDVLRIVEHLHESLRGTRGAAALVCLYTAGWIDACRIGDVEMRCERARFSTVPVRGVLGGDMQRLRVFGGPVSCPDRVVIHSDGVSARFDLEGLQALAPSEACRAIMDVHRRRYDDASVVVADLRDPRDPDPPS